MCYGHAHAVSQSHESQSLDRMLDWKLQLATPGCEALVHHKEKPNSLPVKSSIYQPQTQKILTTVHRPKPKENNGRRKKSQPSPNRPFSSKLLWGAKSKLEHQTMVQTILLCTDPSMSKSKGPPRNLSILQIRHMLVSASFCRGLNSRAELPEGGRVGREDMSIVKNSLK